MKSLLKSFLVVASALLTLTACEKEQEKLLLDFSAVPVVSVSAPTVVLTKDNADKDALTISWPKPNYGYDAAANYTIMVDKKGGDFSKAATFPVGTSLSKTFKASELNSLLLGLGLVPATAGDVDVKVMSALGGRTVLSSALASVKATPYLDRLDLSSPWGVVGDATANGWNGPDQPFYKTSTTGELVSYVTLTDGFIKFRTNNDWAYSLGGAAGKLTADNGPNIAVKAGTYKITINPTALTYKIDPFSWGVVGDATANGWNGPDQNFFYDPSTDQWRAIVTLKAGEIKFRQNNDWAVNFSGLNGKLIQSNDNIKVAAAGTYLITADFKATALTYAIEAYKPWGLVGSATPKGWDGPDILLLPDFSKDGYFYANNVKLADGEVKFRQDNKWDNNYGLTGGVFVKNSSDNIKVTAGTYDVVFDLTNASAPKYKLMKK
ncbi:SusE domain-containing protein [Fibrella forsythiae]|uniref:SusE domain-containing protein n=1 Tax=Fibrella forsythiae TaxID=2817061 RepID=A0ABS3JC96_9BACT|nr:SusE domain-containing protein [Fibrella forsythiae]MBO0947616.1 SusE domain-containing protein [Fibrella forsythiae]